jgi:16S rRNA (cytosine1402-N4)-methyltransferase
MEHVPVLFQEVLDGLNLKKGSAVIDATISSGGHALGILERTKPSGRLLGIDRDPKILPVAQDVLKSFGSRVSLTHGNFKDLKEIAKAHGFDRVDGILLDLGLSTYQLSDPLRGFSFQIEAPLDMRMDPDDQITAADIVNRWNERDLSDLFFQIGEDRFARRVARRIVETRAKHPIVTTGQLIEAIAPAYPPKFRFGRRTHFATNVFRALRVTVNHELSDLESTLPQTLDLLKPQGRLLVLTFHSLEDRLVKHFLKETSGIKPETKKPIVPKEEEIRKNPRARSAKLRIGEKTN